VPDGRSHCTSGSSPVRGTELARRVVCRADRSVALGPQFPPGYKAQALAVPWLGDAFLGTAARDGKAYATPELLDRLNRDLAVALRANPIVEAPSDILLVVRVMGLLSGIGKQLDSRIVPFVLQGQS
jgi:hypothetical protein